MRCSAVTVMYAFYPRLAHAVFDPWLNAAQSAQLTSIMALKLATLRVPRLRPGDGWHWGPTAHPWNSREDDA
jgi:hypothetical protein